MEETIRLLHGLETASKEDIERIITAAIRLERALYADAEYGGLLFTLRKSLEGVWGHDIPELDGPGTEVSDG